MKVVYLIAALCCFLTVALAEVEKVPILQRRITDFTGTLSPSQIRSLEHKLSAFEDSSSNQIVVVVVPTSGEETIEQYSLRVAEANKLGKKGRDNGILLLIAKEDRALRFEVGYGLEGRMPDAVCDQIIRRVIIPEFRDGNFYEGIDAGIDAAIAATRGEFTGDGGKEKRNQKGFPVSLIVIITLLMIMFNVLRSRRRYIGSGGHWGGFGGGGFGGGGFSSGGFGGGSFGGGGGFSGGGGSFGGGGASGRW